MRQYGFSGLSGARLQLVSDIDQAGKIKGQLALGSASLCGDALKGSNASNR